MENTLLFLAVGDFYFILLPDIPRIHYTTVLWKPKTWPSAEYSLKCSGCWWGLSFSRSLSLWNQPLSTHLCRVSNNMTAAVSLGQIHHISLSAYFLSAAEGSHADGCLPRPASLWAFSSQPSLDSPFFYLYLSLFVSPSLLSSSSVTGKNRAS